MSPASGLTRIGGSVRYCLIATNAWSHSSFHSAPLALLRVVKKGFKRSMNREIKRPREANRPISCWIPFLELGADVTPRNLYRYKLGKIIMKGICIGISYAK